MIPSTDWFVNFYRQIVPKSPARQVWRKPLRQEHAVQRCESLEDRVMLSAVVNEIAAGNLQISGTEGGDEIEVRVENSVLILTVNGVSSNYSLSEYGTFQLDGLGGEDILRVEGTSTQETATFQTDTLLFNHAEFTIDAESFEKIDVYSHGGEDIALFRDSAGADNYFVHPEMASLRGMGYRSTAHGFTNQTANATEGGLDQAYLYDSEGDDTFDLAVTSSSITRTNFSSTLNGFEKVYAISQNGGNDQLSLATGPGNDTLVVHPEKTTLVYNNIMLTAIGFTDITVDGTNSGTDRAFVYDSEADDTVVMSPTSFSLTREGYSLTMDDFEKVQVYSNRGGNDSVTFNDSVLNDVFTAGPDYASMTSFWFKNYAYGFNTVIANSNAGGIDKAYLSGGSDKEEFSFDSVLAEMSNTGFSVTAHQFEVYHLNARTGGEDALTVTDSSADDIYVVRPTYSYMRNNGVLIYARGFSDILVNASVGGMDRAYFYDTTADDQFTITPDEVALLGTNFRNRATGFERVYAYSNYGGNDTMWIEGSDGDDHFHVKPEYARLVSGSSQSFAVGFETIHADAHSGENDVALFTDSTGNELFTEMGSYGQYETGDLTVYAHRFDSLKLYGNNGGSNRYRTMTELEAAFTKIGDWLYEEYSDLAIAGVVTIDSTNVNADVTFVDARTTSLQGIFAESVEIGYTKNGNNTSLAVSVSTDGNGDHQIIVELATDGNGDVTTTSAQITAAINNDANANALVMAIEEGDGSGVVDNNSILPVVLPDGVDGLERDVTLETPATAGVTTKLFDHRASAGTVTIDCANANADVTFTDARVTDLQGIFADAVDIEYVKTGNNTSLSVQAATDGNGDHTITVRLATDANGDVTSTAALISTAINNDAAANALVEALAEGDGSGVVDNASLPVVTLADGVDGGLGGGGLKFTDARTTLTQGIFTPKIFIEMTNQGHNQTLGATVETDSEGNHTIAIKLATDANGTITSTASEVEALLKNDNNINAFISTIAIPGYSWLVTETEKFQLSHGTNATFS